MIGQIVLVAMLLAGAKPGPDLGGSASGDAFDLHGAQGATGVDTDRGSASSASKVEWLDCGVISDAGSAGAECQQAAQTCYVDRLAADLPVPGVNDETHYEVELTRQADGTWLVTDTRCLIPNQNAQPAPDYGGAAYQQIRKLVPSPKIGIAPAGGATLVNIQTLLWLDTKPDLDLGTATLLGASVELRAHLDHVTWDFGDGESDTTHDPGRAYTEADPCDTKLCDGYWGHVYAHRGPVTISATATWTGEYRVGAGAWQAIPGQATAAPATTNLTIKQARGVLVPNPDN